MIDLTNPEAKSGALAALDILKKSKLFPLRVRPGNGQGGKLSMPKNVKEVEDDLTDDELREIDPEAADDKEHGINRVDAAKDELEKDRDEILGQIKNDTKKRRLDVAAAKAREMEKIKAETQKYSTVTSVSNFGSDLQHAIKSQIRLATKPEDTYLKVNPTYAGSRYIMPGQKVLEKRNKAVINVYFDVSGSVNEHALELAKNTLASLDIYAKRNLVKYNIYYFANVVRSERVGCGGGTHAFPHILQHIKETKATNVIIITDDDFDRQSDWDSCQEVSLPGAVWWFWNNKQRATKALPWIKAKGGIFQYWVE